MRAAFFDLDKTVIAKSSLVAFGPEFHARGLLHRRTLVWAVLSQMMFMRFGADEEKLDKIRQSVLQITKGWDHLEVKRLVAETINEVIEPLIYEEALELIDYHLAQGDEVWLVSMSPAEIVEPFAELRAGNFDRDIPIQTPVMGAIHFAHPTFASGRKYLVRTEFVADRKRHLRSPAKFSRSRVRITPG